MLKPYYTYTFRSQSLLSISISDHPFPFTLNPITKINYSLRNSIFFPIPTFLSLLRLSQSNPTLTHRPILCARNNNRRGNRKMLQLASMIALNLKIFPEPFNSLIAEIARGGSNGVRPEYLILKRLAGRGKKTERRNKLMWFVFVLISVAGFLSWRISELDLFLRALLFCLVGVSLIRLCWGKKAIKEWFLGFFFGIVLMMNSRLGKEDVKFWVEKLRTCSPVAQIAIGRNKNRRISKRKA